MAYPRQFNHKEAYEMRKRGDSYYVIARAMGVSPKSARDAIIRYEQKDTDRRLVTNAPKTPLRRYSVVLLKAKQDSKCANCGKKLPANPIIHHKRYFNTTINDLEAYCSDKCHMNKNHSKRK